MPTIDVAPRRPSPRRTAALVAIVVAVTLALFGAATPAFASDSGTLASLVNRDRAAHGLRALSRSGSLDAVAASWARHMASAGRMSHNPNLAGQVPSGWRALGENVAMGQRSPQQVETAWMNSAGHRANILGDYTHVGVAFIVASGTTWSVEVFAKYPVTAKAKAPAPKKAPAKPTPKKVAPAKPKATTPAQAKPAKPKPAPAQVQSHAVKAAPAPAAPRASATPARSTATPSATSTPAAKVAAAPDASVTATPAAVALEQTSAATPVALPLGVATAVLAAAAVAVGVLRRRRT
jgi:hypothetical protein